ncbi:MAG: hypothetical protein ACOYT8_06380 [Candidatus Dependentiae bacterium]
MKNIWFLTGLVAFSPIASLFASEPAYNAAAHEAYYREKAARREVENEIKKTLQKYLELQCPKNDGYSLVDKLFFASWTQECKSLSFELKVLREQVRSKQKQIDAIKKNIHLEQLK